MNTAFGFFKLPFDNEGSLLKSNEEIQYSETRKKNTARQQWEINFINLYESEYEHMLNKNTRNSGVKN